MRQKKEDFSFGLGNMLRDKRKEGGYNGDVNKKQNFKGGTKMKRMKKFIALGLALVTLAASLTACGDSGNAPADSDGQTKEEGSAAPADEEKKEDASSAEDGEKEDASAQGGSEEGGAAPAEGQFKIGYNFFGPGSYALDTLAGNQAYVIESFGDTYQDISDDFQVDKIVQDIENLISSKCDGIIIWLPADNLYQTVIDKCTEAKIPFVFADKVPSDPAIKEALMDNEYFAGAVGPANAEYGTLIAEYALGKGYKSCIISTGAQGDPTDTPRIEAFKSAFEAGGGEVMQEVYTDSQDNIQPYTENALIAYPDVDFVYGTGSDYGIGACAAAKNQFLETKVLTSGLDSGALELLEDGTYMEFVNGDFWVSGIMATVLLENYLHGNPIKDADGNPVWVDDIMPFEVSADKFADFKACFVDNKCYSKEEIQAMNGITYDQFIENIKNYSLEERLAANK